MADLKLTATALYVDRFCEIGEKKKKKQDAGIYCFQKYTINLKEVRIHQNTKREATTFIKLYLLKRKRLH